jgi:hypothetical protein
VHVIVRRGQFDAVWDDGIDPQAVPESLRAVPESLRTLLEGLRTLRVPAWRLERAIGVA